MIFDIYNCIIILCVLSIITLACWLLAFIFKKLNLTAIYNFFDIITWIMVILIFFSVISFGIILGLSAIIFIFEQINNFLLIFL